MIPLVVRSHFSLMWGTASIAALCRHAKNLGYTRLALTDTDNLYGLWTFLSACKREGITPIVGAEVTDPKLSLRAVCLVATATGYSHLCRLITRRHRLSSFSLKKDLPLLSEGLVVLTQNPDLLDIFYNHGVTVAAAMPRRPLPGHHPLRIKAKQLRVPLVAVPGTFFLQPDDWHTHRLLRAIDKNTTLGRLVQGSLAPKDAWLAGPKEYEQRFAVCPKAISATYTLAEQLNFSGPQFGLVMPPWQGDNADAALRQAAYTGACKRYGSELAEPVVERLEQELAIIARMGFSAYFLTVQEIVAESSRTCGRGSGAASIVAYCLGITNVCPLKFNLYFGRFLHPGRNDPPDIDVDFAWDERDDVINGLLVKHRGHAAMVCSQVLFQPRMAVRESAKVFGLGQAEIGQFTKRLPAYWRESATKTDFLTQLKERPQSRGLDFIDPWPEILTLAQKLIGIPRYLSVHPGGVVITPDPIDHYVPVEQAPKGVPVIQWEKDSVETAGLVKIDLLGNRSLGVIRDTLDNMRKNGIRMDENHWEPEDDFATQEALAQGRTMGCFYIESPAMRLLQQKSGVGDFDHLVIHSSIIRPAANEFIQEYLRRLHGGRWDPIHPLLNDVLDETFGIMVYQEDVSRAAVALAGFSHTAADGLRKIISKKEKQLQLIDYKQRFTDGSKDKGVPKKTIEAVWAMMMSFDGYSFCKPHSASYARVSFQAAYLKVHFPAEFMAAVISNQGGFYNTFAYVSEARRLGLTILPPDIYHSRIRWQGQENSLRVGFLSIKGLGQAAMERMVKQRKARNFDGLTDFLDRCRLDETEVRALIHCGALDAFTNDGNRTELLWQWHLRQKKSSVQQMSGNLFDIPSTTEEQPPPMLPPEDPHQRLRNEFKALDFLCDRHPMTLFSQQLSGIATVKACHLSRWIGRKVILSGWLITAKVVRTKNGDPMEFLTFEDETGLFETTFFPKVYARFCHQMDRGRPYLLYGVVDENWGAVTLTVERVTPFWKVNTVK
jgi:DNA polymerase-3 subunit alpha/error-prone DNA polymerase